MFGIVVALATASADGQIFGTPPTATPTPSTVVARMGEPMTEARAIHAVAFVPFVPPRQIVITALIPPFHGADAPKTRGIAFEYADAAGRRYALAEWPANGGTIDRFSGYDGEAADCPNVRSFPRRQSPSGIVWSTPLGRIMTLQPDGASDARMLKSEWKKLIRRGACR